MVIRHELPDLDGSGVRAVLAARIARLHAFERR